MKTPSYVRTARRRRKTFTRRKTMRDSSWTMSKDRGETFPSLYKRTCKRKTYRRRKSESTARQIPPLESNVCRGDPEQGCETKNQSYGFLWVFSIESLFFSESNPSTHWKLMSLRVYKFASPRWRDQFLTPEVINLGRRSSQVPAHAGINRNFDKWLVWYFSTWRIESSCDVASKLNRETDRGWREISKRKEKKGAVFWRETRWKQNKTDATVFRQSSREANPRFFVARIPRSLAFK